VAKLKQRNLNLAGENAALRRQLKSAFEEIKMLQAQFDFATSGWRRLDLEHAEAEYLKKHPDPHVTDSKQYFDHLLNRVETIAEEIRNAR
jgi:hypothetical protein